MNCLLALDQSTSATKAHLFDQHARHVASEMEPHRQRYPRAGWVEHDAEEIWANTLAVVRRLMHRQPQVRVVGVSIANQRETVVVFDRNTGRPLLPAIVWQCRRGDALCAEQLAAGRGEDIRRRTGLRIDGYFSASKLQWLMREHPVIAALASRGEALFGTIDAFLVYRLTGGKVFATDATNASRTLLFNIHQLGWDAELCRYWQVPAEALPKVQPSDASFGETDFDGALSAPIPICGIMGDSQAAMFAHRCLIPGSGKATLGTGASVMVNVGDTVPKSDRGTVAALAWMRAGKPTFAAEGIINSCTATLGWLRDQLGILASVPESEQLSVEVRGDDSVYVVPAFSGLGAPYWRDQARAAIVGLSSHSDRRHVVKAALECIGFQLRDVLEMMRQDTGLAIGQIRVDGGAVSNAFLMQFIADILGIELLVSAHEDGAALGAALMGAGALGMETFAEGLAARSRSEISYRPRMTRGEADARYAGWRKAVERVLLNS